MVAEEYALTAVGLVPFMDKIKERLEGMPMFSKGDESAKVGMSNLLSSTYVLILGGEGAFFSSFFSNGQKIVSRQ